MAMTDEHFQLVTFQLGEELYGVDIMDVKEIVKIQDVRQIPNSPYYVEGFFHLRNEFIPIISLHKRFHIQTASLDNSDEGGFVILKIGKYKIGIIIDRIARVLGVSHDEVQPPQQMITGIGTEYINGVIRQESGYLILLDIRKLFNPAELQKLTSL